MKIFNQPSRTSAIAKELAAIQKKEIQLQRAAENARPATWKSELEKKIPQKVYVGLESAFSKGFSLVFQQGTVIIEKSYSKEDIKADHAVRNYAVQVRGSKKELRMVHKGAKHADFLNMAVTTVEGIGLGIMGIGIPDIVLFLGLLLKGVYETALCYGFDYESRQEQLFILKMLETALTAGPDWMAKNRDIDQMLIYETVDITDDIFADQLQKTASVFAMDMLLLKFIQGLPVVGMIGGAANPLYYSKIMKYVGLKYHKRYLMNQLHKESGF